MDGGHKSAAIGLACYKCLRHHHNVHTMLESKSYMDPRPGHSAINDSSIRMGRLLAANGVKVFQIETTLNSETFPSQLGFLNKREWEWSMKDQALMMAAKKGNDLAPPRVRRDSSVGSRRRTRSRASTRARWKRCTSGRSGTCTASSWSR